MSGAPLRDPESQTAGVPVCLCERVPKLIRSSGVTCQAEPERAVRMMGLYMWCEGTAFVSCFHCLHGYGTAFASCFHRLRGYDTAFASCFRYPSSLRHCLCIVFLLPF